MKIIYLITTMSHGRGGHIYSLKTTVESLRTVVEPLVINIGKQESPILRPINYAYIHCNGWNYLSTLYKILKLIKKKKIDVLHPFDTDSLFFARIISYIFKIPIVYTKCGGENPNKYSPYVKDFILYSNENLEFFKNKFKYNKSNFYLIPNRVNKIKKDITRINLLKSKVETNKTIFLRIARFSPAYIDSMKQSIDLIILLNRDVEMAQLIIIGTIQDIDSFKIIKEYIKENKNIFLFTDDIFTLNASELIDSASYIIGTGRGLMEAASLKKVLLTPMQGTNYPVLVNQSNFVDFFHTNFSPRNKLKNFDEQNNIDNILKCMKDDRQYINNSSYLYNMYEKYFNIQNSLSIYRALYSKIKYNKKTYIFDFFLHFTITLKHYIWK